MSAENNQFYWRKTKDKGLIDTKKIDDFIELALSKFNYTSIEALTDKFKINNYYYILNKTSLVPDLIVYSDEFNKNECFYDFKGTSYNKYPRRKFVLEKSLSPFFAEGAKNENESFEEDPQWGDVSIKDIVDNEMVFECLPKNDTVSEHNDLVDKLFDQDLNDIDKSFNENKNDRDQLNTNKYYENSNKKSNADNEEYNYYYENLAENRREEIYNDYKANENSQYLNQNNSQISNSNSNDKDDDFNIDIFKNDDKEDEDKNLVNKTENSIVIEEGNDFQINQSKDNDGILNQNNMNMNMNMGMGMGMNMNNINLMNSYMTQYMQNQQNFLQNLNIKNNIGGNQNETSQNQENVNKSQLNFTNISLYPFNPFLNFPNFNNNNNNQNSNSFTQNNNQNNNQNLMGNINGTNIPNINLFFNQNYYLNINNQNTSNSNQEDQKNENVSSDKNIPNNINGNLGNNLTIPPFLMNPNIAQLYLKNNLMNNMNNLKLENETKSFDNKRKSSDYYDNSDNESQTNNTKPNNMMKNIESMIYSDPYQLIDFNMIHKDWIVKMDNRYNCLNSKELLDVLEKIESGNLKFNVFEIVEKKTDMYFTSKSLLEPLREKVKQFNLKLKQLASQNIIKDTTNKNDMITKKNLITKTEDNKNNNNNQYRNKNKNSKYDHNNDYNNHNNHNNHTNQNSQNNQNVHKNNNNQYYQHHNNRNYNNNYGWNNNNNHNYQYNNNYNNNYGFSNQNYSNYSYNNKNHDYNNNSIQNNEYENLGENNSFKNEKKEMSINSDSRKESVNNKNGLTIEENTRRKKKIVSSENQ